MTTSLSRLRGLRSPLILDASVLINLVGSGVAGPLMRALGIEIFAEVHAVDEVIRNPHDARPGHAVIRALSDEGAIGIKSLKSGLPLFMNLTGANPPDDLGDGEAATLALASELNGIAVIDENKAARIAATVLPPIACCCSLDLYTVDSVADSLGDLAMQQALFNSIFHARMRVPAPYRDWVRSKLGPTLCSQCPTLKG